MDFSSSDRIIERLHRLLVVLEDESKLIGREMPPLAVFDVRANRWLLASRISLSALRGDATDGNRDASYVIVIGDTVVPVVSAGPEPARADVRGQCPSVPENLKESGRS